MTNQPPRHFMHILNLDTLGGVETLYMHFLRHSWKRDKSLPLTCISGKKIHPVYQKWMKEIQYTPFYERYIWGMRLSKQFSWLSDIRRWVMREVSSTSLCVFWNRIESTPPPYASLYYEHGATWDVQPTTKHKQFWEKCTQAICVSEAAHHMLLEKIGLTCPIQVVPNPLRPDVLLAEDCKKKPQEKVHLGFIGRFLPIKAPGVALYTLAELRSLYKLDADLTMIGCGKELSFLQKEAQRLGLNKHIHFIETCEHVERFYDSIDILLVPSMREPLGLVALEASARGVPVIATCVDGLAESVIDGQSGILISPTEAIRKSKFIASLEGLPDIVFDPRQKKLVDPKLPSPTAFAQAVIDLLENPNSYENISRGGISHARSRANFNEYCNTLITLFHATAQLHEDNQENT